MPAGFFPTSLPLDSNGWSVLTYKQDSCVNAGLSLTQANQSGVNYAPGSYDNGSGTLVVDVRVQADGTRTIYVDSVHGSDANVGTQNHPKQTLVCTDTADGWLDYISRNNKPTSPSANQIPWLMLAKGSNFSLNLTNYPSGVWIQYPSAGLDSQNRTYIGSYGTGSRPILDMPNGGTGPYLWADNIAIIGIHVTSSQRNYNLPNPPYVGDANILHTVGFSKPATATSSNVLIENCYIDFLSLALSPSAGTGTNNMELRRNVIVDQYSPGDISCGMSGEGYTGLLIEENDFDYNGVFENTGFDTRNHNIYNGGAPPNPTPPPPTGGSQQVTIRGNVISRSGNGDQYRTGWQTIDDNLYFGTTYFQSIGNENANQPTYIQNNVMTGAIVIVNNESGGGALVFNPDVVANTPSNLAVTYFTNNIFFNSNPAGGGESPINWQGADIPGEQVNGNVAYNWNASVLTDTQWMTLYTPSNISGTNFIDIQGVHGMFPTADATLKTIDLGSYLNSINYNGSSSGHTVMDYINACRGQSKDNWNPALLPLNVNNYFRSLFGRPAYTYNPPGGVVVSPTSLANGYVGVPYSDIIVASGGTPPYDFTFTGSLPTGMTLGHNGVLGGTPTVAGGFSFTVTATDSLGASAQQPYTVTPVFTLVMQPTGAKALFMTNILGHT